MKLSKYFLLVLAWLFLSVPLQAQIKPTAMLLPIYFVDLDKKGLQGSLNNHVQTELSSYYELKSEKEIEQARDAAIDKLSSKNCTEEACVKIMGELLDVEYTFSLEIIDTGEGWDLTAVRQGLDGVTSRRNELCKNCSLSKARKTLSGMLTALRPGEMLIQRGKASLRLESTPRSKVFLDGRDQGKTPLDLSVDARKPLDVSMLTEGYKEFSRKFILEPGEKRIKHVNLVRKRGKINIVSDPSGAKIYLDGKPQLDSSGRTMTTPEDLYLVYGQHVLKLQLEKYEDRTQRLKINRQNLGKKVIKLKPKPGRLVVRVPSENKNANVYINNIRVGSMDGSISKTFNVPANRSLQVEVKDQRAFSGKKSVRVKPDGSGSVSFDWLRTQDSGGFRFGLAFEQDYFSLTLEGAGGTKILSNYSVSGISVHGILSPGRHLLSLKFLNGSGTITEPSTPFYLVSGDQLYTVTGTNANVFRLLYSPQWEPGWNYALGWESISFNFEAAQGTQTHVVSSFLTEGGYDFSSFSDWMMQNSLSLETRLRYSLMNGIGYTFGVSWTF
jgi:hypothetical protein